MVLTAAYRKGFTHGACRHQTSSNSSDASSPVSSSLKSDTISSALQSFVNQHPDELLESSMAASYPVVRHTHSLYQLRSSISELDQIIPLQKRPEGDQERAHPLSYSSSNGEGDLDGEDNPSTEKLTNDDDDDDDDDDDEEEEVAKSIRFSSTRLPPISISLSQLPTVEGSNDLVELPPTSQFSSREELHATFPGRCEIIHKEHRSSTPSSECCHVALNDEAYKRIAKEENGCSIISCSSVSLNGNVNHQQPTYSNRELPLSSYRRLQHEPVPSQSQKPTETLSNRLNIRTNVTPPHAICGRDGSSLSYNPSGPAAPTGNHGSTCFVSLRKFRESFEKRPVEPIPVGSGATRSQTQVSRAPKPVDLQIALPYYPLLSKQPVDLQSSVSSYQQHTRVQCRMMIIPTPVTQNISLIEQSIFTEYLNVLPNTISGLDVPKKDALVVLEYLREDKGSGNELFCDGRVFIPVTLLRLVSQDDLFVPRGTQPHLPTVFKNRSYDAVSLDIPLDLCPTTYPNDEQIAESWMNIIAKELYDSHGSTLTSPFARIAIRTSNAKGIFSSVYCNGIAVETCRSKFRRPDLSREDLIRQHHRSGRLHTTRPVLDSTTDVGRICKNHTYNPRHTTSSRTPVRDMNTKNQKTQRVHPHNPTPELLSDSSRRSHPDVPRLKVPSLSPVVVVPDTSEADSILHIQPPHSNRGPAPAPAWSTKLFDHNVTNLFISEDMQQQPHHRLCHRLPSLPSAAAGEEDDELNLSCSAVGGKYSATDVPVPIFRQKNIIKKAPPIEAVEVITKETSLTTTPPRHQDQHPSKSRLFHNRRNNQAAVSQCCKGCLRVPEDQLLYCPCHYQMRFPENFVYACACSTTAQYCQLSAANGAYHGDHYHHADRRHHGHSRKSKFLGNSSRIECKQQPHNHNACVPYLLPPTRHAAALRVVNYNDNFVELRRRPLQQTIVFDEPEHIILPPANNSVCHSSRAVLGSLCPIDEKPLILGPAEYIGNCYHRESYQRPMAAGGFRDATAPFFQLASPAADASAAFSQYRHQSCGVQADAVKTKESSLEIEQKHEVHKDWHMSQTDRHKGDSCGPSEIQENYLSQKAGNGTCWRGAGVERLNDDIPSKMNNIVSLSSSLPGVLSRKLKSTSNCSSALQMETATSTTQSTHQLRLASNTEAVFPRITAKKEHWVNVRQPSEESLQSSIVSRQKIVVPRKYVRGSRPKAFRRWRALMTTNRCATSVEQCPNVLRSTVPETGCKVLFNKMCGLTSSCMFALRHDGIAPIVRGAVTKHSKRLMKLVLRSVPQNSPYHYIKSADTTTAVHQSLGPQHLRNTDNTCSQGSIDRDVFFTPNTSQELSQTVVEGAASLWRMSVNKFIGSLTTLVKLSKQIISQSFRSLLA